MTTSAPRVVRHARNTVGRDFAMGDVHGTYGVVEAVLRAVSFDWSRDRLFSVGDLVDRGPEPRRALAFARNPRIHPIRGNHEDMFLECYADGVPDEAVLRYMTSRNGMSWWMDLTHEERMPLIEAFRSLPLAIEIETERGLVGIVHAEVPVGMSWPDFIAALEAGDPAATKSALWGRTRLTHGIDAGVRGVDRVFCGHTIVDAPTRLGNVYFVDSGSFVGVLSGDGTAGRLVVADLISCTQAFAPAPTGEYFDLRVEAAASGVPFGSYAR